VRLELLKLSSAKLSSSLYYYSFHVGSLIIDVAMAVALITKCY